MTDELTRYEVRWRSGSRGLSYHLQGFSTLLAAETRRDELLSTWGNPGDEVEIVKLTGISAETISRKVKGAPPA